MSGIETTTELQSAANETVRGIFDKLVDSRMFLLEPWFMGAGVILLLIIIIFTILYAMLFQRRNRRQSREAILNLTEDQTLFEPKICYRKQLSIIFTCVLLIIILIILNSYAYHMRSSGESFAEINGKIWNHMYSFINEPWLIGIVFGVLLVVAILFSIHSILKETDASKSTEKSKKCKTPMNKLCAQPWFIAFMIAVFVIIILSVALFYLICQKHGEDFMETASRFFLIEPWFFGIVVGVVLITIIVFNIYRILRGNGENYSVNDEQGTKQEIVVESQGFDEYPSKNTMSVENSVNPKQELSSRPTSFNQQQQQQQQEPQQEKQQTSINLESSHIMSSAAVQTTVPPSLSLQLNEGHFYDEKQFHDEDDSMAEYGLGENDQFNDEGSFIGLYNRDRIQNYMAQFNKNNLNN